MMTQAERLVRSLAKTKTKALEDELRAIRRTPYKNDGVAVKSLPLPLQRAVLTVCRHKRAVERAENLLHSHGYQSPVRYGVKPSRRPTRLLRVPDLLRREEQDRLSKVEARLVKLRELRDAVLVRVLGKSPGQAAPILQQFQQDVEVL